MPRENSKTRKWEKERRDRLNEAFTQLAKILPCYDPSVNICKIDILQKAASNIQELQNKIEKLLSSDTEKKIEADIIKKLQDRVKKLLVRNEQLSNLLRDAGISVPSAFGTIKRFKKKNWCRRVSAEQAKLLQKNEMEKENICSKLIHGKKKKQKTVNAGVIPKHTNGVGQKESVSIKKTKKKATSNCFFVLSQPTSARRDHNQQCYLITQSSINIKNVNKTGTCSSRIFSKPLVTSKSRTSKNILDNNSTTPYLGPGTLILANGTILRILPQCQTFQPTLSSSLLNSTISMIPKNLKVQNSQRSQKLTSKNNSSQTNIQYNSINTLPVIQPKYCLTKTTQVNKVPIPALTSRYANNCVLLKETSVKQKEIKKTNKTEETENSNKLNRKESKRKIEAGDEVEHNSKKRKSDGRTESVTNKTCTKDDCSDTSISIINPPNDNNSGLNVTDKGESKNDEITSIKETVCDKNKENGVVENNPGQKEEDLSKSDTSEKISGIKDLEKKQESLITTDNGGSQEPLVVSTEVTTSTTTHSIIKNLDLNLSHSELSNDIFASLQVPSGCQNPESTSPTAAFLLAFPLVSSGVKVTEVIEEENSDSQRGTPTLLQIGTMESTKSTQSQTDTMTSNFLNLDNFSFLPSKDICGNVYNNYSNTTKSSKTTLPTTELITTNKSDIVNKYSNVKSPCLPNCAEESHKENYVFDIKTINSSKVIAVQSSEKKCNNEKENNSTDFSSHNHSSKTSSNFIVRKDTQSQKSFDQKPHYDINSTYSNATCSLNHRSDPAKLCTNSYVNISRNYSNPLYTNCSNYGYNCHPDANFNQDYYKNIPRNQTKTFYPLNYENYSDYRKNDASTIPGGYYETSYVKENKRNNSAKVKTSQNKLPINWMTTPDSRLQNSECLLNSFSKGDFSQTYPFTSYVTSSSTYFITTSTDTTDTSCIMEAKKSLELQPSVSLNSHQRLDTDEKQFSWSTTKPPHFLDHPPNFVTSTLPTLVGDLALGNTLPFGEQKSDYKYYKENKDFKCSNRNSSYENQSNFLSVSQLVDHNKPENVLSKTLTRRNSGSRSKNMGQQKVKRTTKQEHKDLLSNCSINNDKICGRLTGNYNVLSNGETFSEHKNRNAVKNNSSSYSAEALIGSHVPDESLHKKFPPQSSKSLSSSGFLTENIIYFPPVDLPQDSYITQNQNYQTNNFAHNICTSQNNNYAANSFIYAPSTITSSYLSTNNFDASSHDFLQDNLISNGTTKEKHYVKHFNTTQQLSHKDEKNNHNSICPNNMKKTKKKQTNDGNTTLTSFDFPFLSIPGSNNSPILPDDFHSHTNFLPPTFPCKNSVYSKPNDLTTTSILPLPPISRNSTQHPEISPPINTAGTSLTNFNLSTIFPEINKMPFSVEPKLSFSS